MKTFLSFTSHIKALLFKEWKISSTAVLVDTLIGVFVFTILYELVKVWYGKKIRGYQKVWKAKLEPDVVQPGRYGTFSLPSTEEEVPLSTRVGYCFHVWRSVLLTWRYILSSFGHVLLLAAAYLLMLTVMTYNAWVLIIVCVASGVGHYVVTAPNDSTKHDICHDTEGMVHVLQVSEKSLLRPDLQEQS